MRLYISLLCQAAPFSFRNRVHFPQAYCSQSGTGRASHLKYQLDPAAWVLPGEINAMKNCAHCKWGRSFASFPSQPPADAAGLLRPSAVQSCAPAHFRQRLSCIASNEPFSTFSYSGRSVARQQLLATSLRLDNRAPLGAKHFCAPDLLLAKSGFGGLNNTGACGPHFGQLRQRRKIPRTTARGAVSSGRCRPGRPEAEGFDF